MLKSRLTATLIYHTHTNEAENFKEKTAKKNSSNTEFE